LFMNGQQFTMKGEFKGSETNTLYLSYFDFHNDYVKDTIPITDQKFIATGTLNGTQKVLIKSDLSSKGMEDPNLGYFFIEPGETQVILEENNFKNVIVKGSDAQDEYQQVNARVLPMYNEIKDLPRTASNQKIIDSKLEIIKSIELKFAYSNPETHVSAYYVDFYKRSLPLDSLKVFYSKFPVENQLSLYGKAIKDFIDGDSRQPEISTSAPNFHEVDINGKNISMDTFKGKYLLIDFWAGWCKPCLENLPHLRDVYDKYNSQGLEILGVSFDVSKEDWKKAVSKHNLEDWNQIFIGLNNIHEKSSLSVKYGVRPIPAYILVGKDGEIIGRYLNASSDGKNMDDLAAKLEEIF
jgi:peroxiredoxin